MSESFIVEKFVENLPSVDRSYAVAFADGMIKYHRSYRAHRDESINCEVDAEYLAEKSCIAVVGEGDFWIYSPKFTRTLAYAIEHLFKTTIIGLWVDYVRTTFTAYFVDKPGNRWGVELFQENERIKIYAIMPRLGTLYSITRALSAEEMDQQGKNATCAVLMNDVSAWNMKKK